MSWTFDQFVLAVVGDFLGEFVVEFGDIQSDKKNAAQKTVILYDNESLTKSANPEQRAAEAWDYAQQWADRSGRPIRLRVSGQWAEDGSCGTWGVKTFQPRIQSGTEAEPPLTTKSAFSEEPAVGFAKETGEYGTWYIPYGKDEGKQVLDRLPGCELASWTDLPWKDDDLPTLVTFLKGVVATRAQQPRQEIAWFANDGTAGWLLRSLIEKILGINIMPSALEDLDGPKEAVPEAAVTVVLLGDEYIKQLGLRKELENRIRAVKSEIPIIWCHFESSEVLLVEGEHNHTFVVEDSDEGSAATTFLSELMIHLKLTDRVLTALFEFFKGQS